MTVSYRHINNILWFVFIATAVLCLLFAYYGYPVLTYDSPCFLPAAVSLKNGNGLVNPFYDAGFIPGGKFLFYPPLFPAAMSLLMFGPGAAALYGAIGIINLLTITTAFLILKKMISRYGLQGKNKWMLLLFAVFWLPANCTFVIPNNSRPEMLCRLILYLLILLQLVKIPFKKFLCGILYAASFITSPVFGIYLSAIILLYIIYTNGINGLLPFIAGGLLVFVLFLVLYPYSITDMLQTMKIHSANVVFARNEGFSVKNFITYHVLANNASFGFLLFITAVIASVIYFSPAQRISRIFFTGITAALVILILYFSFRNLPMSYYIYVLAPLLLYIIAYAWFNTSRALPVMALSVLIVMVSFSFLRLSASFIVNAGKTQYGLAAVNHKLDVYRQMQGKTVAVSGGLWPFFISNTASNVFIYDLKPGEQADYLVLQQYATGKMVPDEIANYELIENNFDKNTSVFAKIISSRYPPFYQYAVYKRK